MKVFAADIEEKTEENSYFRQVLYTGQHLQLVVMSLKPGEEIGFEIHAVTDQFLRIEEGEGKVIVGNKEYAVEDDSAVIVPAGARHNVINTSSTEDLRLYTIYAPPHHRDKTIHKTKEEAESDKEDHL